MSGENPVPALPVARGGGEIGIVSAMKSPSPLAWVKQASDCDHLGWGRFRWGRPLLLLFGLAIMIAGAVSLAGAARSMGRAVVGEMLIERAWHRTLATGEAQRPWPWADFVPVARLDFPRIGESAVVIDSASGLGMSWGIGHVDGTAEPGEPGLSAFGGHRDSHFAFLQHVRKGDYIFLNTRDGIRRKYRVRGTYVVDAEQWRFPAGEPDGVSRLALSTCWPFDGQMRGEDRFILTAEEVGENSPKGEGAPVSSTQPQPGGRAGGPGSPARPL